MNSDHAENDPLVVVSTYTAPHEAHIARTKLEASGFRAVVADEHVVGVNLWLSNAVGGVKVMVPQSELSEARQALFGEEAAEDALEADWGSCSECGSTSAKLKERERGAGGIIGALLTFLFFDVPWLSGRRKVQCPTCGNEWTLR